MPLQPAAIEAVAPDQASLSAAVKLLKPSLWPVREVSADRALIWGACQGSGANPYRVVVDLSDLGAKCTCPSRKFPCKHALALMLHFSKDEMAFSGGTVPDWVGDWLGRRRKTFRPSNLPAAPKSLLDVHAADPEISNDPKAEARRDAARIRRENLTNMAVSDGLHEMEAWISDQLRTGLAETLKDLTSRCRKIAARLVDAKAATLAARVDAVPAMVLAQPQRMRGAVLAAELGKLVLLSRSWRDGDCSSHIRRDIVSAENRETLLANPDAPRHAGPWEVLASLEEARRDGLIARATWLLGLDLVGPRFALLQDFYPVSVGKQGAAFKSGEQFWAELVFYPAPGPLRAQIAAQRPLETPVVWPDMGQSDPLLGYRETVIAVPWTNIWPVLLPSGRIGQAADTGWWANTDHALPLTAENLPPAILGSELSMAVALWDSSSARLLAAQTHLGRYHAYG